MFKLIFNELYKIFHKKGIYIIYCLIFIFCILNNALFKVTYNDDGGYIDNIKEDLIKEINNLEEELKSKNGLEYITVKTNLDLLKLKNNYEAYSFQYNTIDKYFKDIIYNLNYYEYLEPNKDLKLKYEEIYNNYITRFNNNDNFSFIKEELDTINKQLEVDSSKELELQKEMLTLRISNDIDYGNTYLNRAINDYYEASLELASYSENKKMEFEKQKIYNRLLEVQTISKYIIDNKVNLNKDNDLRGCLKTILEDYLLFIVIVIILVSSTIISEEYSKKTIKLLLVRPYSKTKILLSKYLATIIVLFISILFLIVSELWIGTVIFGIDSLRIPVIVYDFNINNLKEYNVLIYMLIRIMYNLPKLIMLLTIVFTTSCLFYSSIISSLLGFSFYVFGDSLITLLDKYQITKYFLFSNWDFLPYINGNILTKFSIPLEQSILVYFLYFLLIFLGLFVIFKRRDIRNI